MSSGTIIGTVDEAVDRIGAAAQTRGWRVAAGRRSEGEVVLGLSEQKWSGLIHVRTLGPGRVAVRAKRTGMAATVVLVIVTLFALALSLLAGVVACYSAATHPGSVASITFVLLGFVVAGLVALPPARLIWLRRPSRVQRNREMEQLVEALVAEWGDAPSAGEGQGRGQTR